MLGQSSPFVCNATPSQRIPEWEEIAATAMAVQNMWLTCTEMGIGSYWSSPRLIKFMNEFTDMSDGEVCLRIFFTWDIMMLSQPSKPESPIAEKVVWME